MPFEVLLPHELDYDRYARMQRDSYAALLRNAGVSGDFMNPTYYRWKYNPPAGPGRIALYREGDEVFSANAMFPLVIHSGSRSIIGWQSCDVATVPEVRGSGNGRPALYLGCLRELRKQITKDEIFFGYPNANVKLGFLRFGWIENSIIPTYVKAAIVPGGRHDQHVQQVAKFDTALELLAVKLAAGKKTMLDRSAAYLNWRYPEHPVHKYEMFEYRDGMSLEGFLVIREAAIMGRRFALIMDLWGSDLQAKGALFSTATRWARARRIPYLTMVGNYLNTISALRFGYVHIPSTFLPKKQVLMGSGAGPESSSLMNSEWIVQLGDWDGF